MHTWALRLDLSTTDCYRWITAALLHDALRSAPLSVLEEWTPAFTGPADLRHGPAAAAAAEGKGSTDDPEILDAVRWHSLGSADWGALGRALYCADYLEPGRGHHPRIRAKLAKRFPKDPEAVLVDVAKWRRHFAKAEGWQVPKECLIFWESLGA